MSRRMKIMLICLSILFGCIILYKIFMSVMMRYAISHQSQVVTVSTMTTSLSDWRPKLQGSASLRAIRGVNVTTELAGMVQTIYFTPGSTVKEGDVLVQLNADNEIAQLHSLEANLDIAKITYNRDKAQLAVQAVSKQVVDNDAANVKSLEAQVAQQSAIVLKKTVRAPFAGRLGINNVNPGQFVNPGDKIVTLQTLDPIYADYFMPQQSLAILKVGQDVTLTSDTYPGKTYRGKITTIEPAVDVNTRNVQVEATIENPDFELTPGMFAFVEVTTGNPKPFLTVPQTAITFNSYGDIVYVVRDDKDKHDKLVQVARQVFVTTGEIRGDQIQILKGLNPGETIVTSGQLKLKNGSQIAINNTVVPANDPAPQLNNNH